MKYIDLTHKFVHNMPVFPGDPVSELTFLNKDGITDHHLTSGMHVGTHMDAPAHMLENGKLIFDYPAEKFFGRGMLVDARGKANIDIEILDIKDIKRGDILLIFTGWGDKFLDGDYFKNYPVLTESFANKLIELGVSIVGMDTPSPDTAPYKIHKTLLSNDILIIENLTNLKALAGLKNFEIIALPLKMESSASFCRVVARFQ